MLEMIFKTANSGTVSLPGRFKLAFNPANVSFSKNHAYSFQEGVAGSNHKDIFL